jgi:hypothetical protein
MYFISSSLFPLTQGAQEREGRGPKTTIAEAAKTRLRFGDIRSEDQAHLDWRPTGDDSLAPPRQCLVQVSGFQNPKTAYVLLGLQVRPVGDEHLTIGLRPQGFRATDRGEAARRKSWRRQPPSLR